MNYGLEENRKDSKDSLFDIHNYYNPDSNDTGQMGRSGINNRGIYSSGNTFLDNKKEKESKEIKDKWYKDYKGIGKEVWDNTGKLLYNNQEELFINLNLSSY